LLEGVLPALLGAINQ